MSRISPKRGACVAERFELMDGKVSLEEIAHRLAMEFPKRFPGGSKPCRTPVGSRKSTVGRQTQNPPCAQSPISYHDNVARYLMKYHESIFGFWN